MNRDAMICLLIVALAGMGIPAAAANGFTLFDDGDPLAPGGVYDLGGHGRPAVAATPAGAPYSGRQYLTVWGDPVRETCRKPDRISAFIRSDVGLDMSRDWWISLDVANDCLMPDAGFRLWLLDFRPDWTHLNGGNLEDRAMFSLGIGDQVPDDNVRGGIWIEAAKPAGRVGIQPFRLDPVPNRTRIRGGHNYITVEWFAKSKTYRWTVRNANGSFRVTQRASELAHQLARTYIAAGTTDNTYWMASAWTIWKIGYGRGAIPDRWRN